MASLTRRQLDFVCKDGFGMNPDVQEYLLECEDAPSQDELLQMIDQHTQQGHSLYGALAYLGESYYA